MEKSNMEVMLKTIFVLLFSLTCLLAIAQINYLQISTQSFDTKTDSHIQS